MIIHESIKNFDKNAMFFLLLQSRISQDVFLCSSVLIHRLNIFPYFYNQKRYCRWNSFFRFCECLYFWLENYLFNPSIWAKYLLVFLILASWWSAGFKYLAKHHPMHSLSPKILTLINPFLGWYSSLSNFI